MMSLFNDASLLIEAGVYNKDSGHDNLKVKDKDSTFSNFFNDPTAKKGPRQQKWGTGGQRLHQNLLPDMHKVDASLNHKIEILRERPGKLILSQADVNYCRDK